MMTMARIAVLDEESTGDGAVRLPPHTAAGGHFRRRTSVRRHRCHKDGIRVGGADS